MIESKFLKELVDKPISGEWGDDGGNIKVLRTTNFTNERIIDYSDVVVRDIPFEKVETKKLLSGDLIIEKSGGSPKQPVGRVVYFDHSDLFLCNSILSINIWHCLAYILGSSIRKLNCPGCVVVEISRK